MLARAVEMRRRIPSPRGRLGKAVQGGDPVALRALLRSGVSADETVEYGAGGADMPPLHRAAYHGDRPCLLELLMAGADPNKPAAGGTNWRPLHCAAAMGHPGCVELLLTFGADATVADEAGVKPRGYALEGGYSSCVDVLQNAHAYKSRWVAELLAQHCIRPTVLPKLVLDVVADYSLGIRERTAFPLRESDRVSTVLPESW